MRGAHIHVPRPPAELLCLALGGSPALPPQRRWGVPGMDLVTNLQRLHAQVLLLSLIFFVGISPPVWPRVIATARSDDPLT